MYKILGLVNGFILGHCFYWIFLAPKTSVSPYLEIFVLGCIIQCILYTKGEQV